MKIFWIVLLVLLALLALLLAATALLFRFCVARPRRPPKPYDASHAFDPYREQMREGMAWFEAQKCETVSLLSYDGLPLRAKLLPCPNARGSVLLMHGYRSSGPRDFCCVLRLFHELGFHILLPDQRACGDSAGAYTCFGVRERYDCVDWARWLSVRFGADLPIVLDGVSLGATTVLMAAGLELPKNVRLLIADCGFTSPYDIFAHVLRVWLHLPPIPFVPLAGLFAWLLAGFRLREASTVEAMRRNRIPVLFAHGVQDNFVPPSMTQAAYDACTAPKSLLLAEGAAHGMSFLVEQERYTALVTELIDKYL